MNAQASVRSTVYRFHQDRVATLLDFPEETDRRGGPGVNDVAWFQCAQNRRIVTRSIRLTLCNR